MTTRYRPHVLVACVLAAVLLTGMHAVLRNVLTDWRFNWTPRAASGDIVVVAIDAPSIEGVGVWPWPRDVHGALVAKLEAAGASEIAFDVDFSAPSNSQSDQAFVAALQAAGGSVVLAAFKQVVGDRQGGQSVHVNRPLAQFQQYAWPALVNVVADADGLVRRYPYGGRLDGQFVPSLGALLAGKYDSDLPSLRIDFGIRANSVPVVSYLDILRSVPAALNRVAGRKVVIGSTAIELGDRFYVPNGGIVHGVVLQVLAAETLMQERALRAAPVIATIGCLILIALLMIFLWGRTSALWRVLALVGLAGALELGALILQQQLAIVFDASLCHLAILAYLVAIALDEIDFRSLLGGIAESRFQRIAMSLGDGLVCADQHGLITVWNPGAQSIFGYTPDEIVGQPLGRLCVASGDGGHALSCFGLSADALQAGGVVLELEGIRRTGERFPLEASLSQWQGVDGSQYGVVLRDISIRQREAQKIRYLAECDTLTGLANRNTLNAHLAERHAEALAGGREVALLVMDLDKFKHVNDTLGHACGDEMLRAVADRLRTLVDGAGLVARVSGDEFAIVIGGTDVGDCAIDLAQRICRGFSAAPLQVGKRELRVNVSIGVAFYPRDCESADQLVGNADLALYRAKAAGRGRYVVFESGIREELEAALSLEEGLKRGAERDEFALFYQPQVDLENGRLVGAEALIRWRHPERGLVMPAEFMPIANASSVSDAIALWVLETACRQGSRWERMGRPIRIGVNLSPSQFLSGDLAGMVDTTLRDTGFSPNLLELEVTENILLADDDSALNMFRRIQELGVTIAFDDFGTGFASMTHLKKYPLDRLKIDKSFVRELRANCDDAAIVRSTISLSKSLGLSVIAEGVEDGATAELLCSMGCDEGQGYYFGRPMPAAEFERQFLTDDAADEIATPARPAAAAA